MWGNEHNQLCT